jgi:hypothetical protein
MWISYADSEVNVFHPLCEQALNNALKILNIDKFYKVLHHKNTGALEMDYVVQNIATGKYLCVIEIKRTPRDIHSARYQYQTMSYVQMNVAETERSFYILTNLEYAFTFKYDSTRPRVFQQMLKPGLINIGNFQFDDKAIFVRKLSEFFKNLINNFVHNRFEYLLTLEQFATHMENIISDTKQWKSSLAILLYEYIRGAFVAVRREELHDIHIFNKNISRICAEATKINFKDIFTYNNQTFGHKIDIDSNLVNNLFNFGKQNISADSIANVLHQIISNGHEHDGEVATDIELSRVVAELAYHINGDIDKEQLICDPAAGSGNLITGCIDIFGVPIKQIIVNDWNSRLLELLSLRLGLNNVKTVSLKNSPIISNTNIVNLDRTFFKDVQVLVMNPPFVAGINCVERKNSFYNKIKELTGRQSNTNIGQMPLEAVFLELVTLLVKPGTTIACVFPKGHLLGRGIEAKKIRELLLENFGLKVVFTYPDEEIFENVTKSTCVLVGKAMTHSNNIKFISSYNKISDIDMNIFSESLKTKLTANFSPIMSGVNAKESSYNELKINIDNAWRELNSELVVAINFIKNKFASLPKLQKFKDANLKIKRGSVGNNGGSNLLFFDSDVDLFNKFKDQVLLMPGMRNAKSDIFLIKDGDSKILDVKSMNKAQLRTIVKIYNNLPIRKSKQQRISKTNKEWIDILYKNSRNISSANSVLIPRAIRRSGKIYLADNDIFVSTNFFIISDCLSKNDAVLLSTWMTTVFYQLICEISSKNNEGVRKMELIDIAETYVPKFTSISKKTYELLEAELEKITFLDLKAPTIRDIDKIWGQVLFGIDADKFLEEAKNLLEFLANSRNA